MQFLQTLSLRFCETCPVVVLFCYNIIFNFHLSKLLGNCSSFLFVVIRCESLYILKEKPVFDQVSYTSYLADY